MIAVIIILCILLFLILLAFLPISLRFTLMDDFSFRVKFVGIKFYDNKQKKNKGQKAEEKDNETVEKKDNFFVKECKKRGIKDGIKYVLEALKELLPPLKFVIKRTTFKIFLIDLTVASDNAADTAIEYGGVCSLTYPVLSFLNQYARFKLKRVNIRTDFDSTSYDFKADILLSIGIGFALIAAVKIYKKYISLKKESELNE